MKEIERLHEMLLAEGIEHEWIDCTSDLDRCHGIDRGYQILVWQGDSILVSAIQNDSSYGGNHDLIEICGLLTPEEKKFDTVAGWLTADDVFSRIKAAVSVTV